VSPVVFVTLAEGISACEQLASAVRRGPLETDLTFPYHPHVTVAHHLEDLALDRAFSDLATFEAAFEVGHFSLYVHHPEAGWVPTRDFPLGGPAGDRTEG
jgi:2'-5' RNA ligase